MDISAWSMSHRFLRAVLFLYKKYLRPHATDEDVRRKEGILNILLFASSALSFILLLIVGYNHILLGDVRKGVPVAIMACIFAAFLFLLVLSHRGHFRLAAFLLLFLYFLPTTYGLYAWGADFPQGVLTYALLLIMSSVLIGTGFSLWMMVLVSCVLLFVTYGQLYGAMTPLVYWKQRPTTMQDGVAVVITLVVITVTSWLSNREIERSLHRARASETALKRERDFLEVKVEERTSELKKVQIEKMTQMYRFVEFGRLSSGFFHDMASPLTALSLNLRHLQGVQGLEAQEVRASVDRAVQTAKKLEGFLEIMRKQLRQQEQIMTFSVVEEIKFVFQTLDHKARSAHVRFLISTPDSDVLRLRGNPLKFNKIIMNLVSNAIDAYEESVLPEEQRIVVIGLGEQTEKLHCTVRDQGRGIEARHMTKIFEPFFTTKSFEKGMGIGLCTIKEIVEKDFQGHIEVESVLGKGSVFTVHFFSRVAPA